MCIGDFVFDERACNTAAGEGAVSVYPAHNARVYLYRRGGAWDSGGAVAAKLGRTGSSTDTGIPWCWQTFQLDFVSTLREMTFVGSRGVYGL